ncbi:MAG: Clp protease ClpP [Thermoanaerobaculia bacterium]|nr:Clp protease ClpP [Thermoanaerobaculia bacterium]
MRSWYAIRARAEGAEVSIYDEIGAYGVSAKSFLDELGALPDDGALTLRLNSPGGSVFDAVAIYNALKRHAGPVSVWIDGIAASAASYVAMAGDEVVMPENAFLMIHDPSGVVYGTADDMRAMAEALDKIKGSLVAGYVAKSGGAEDDIAALMAKETWLAAAEAVELGFADRLAEPVRIAARFDIARFRNAPPALVDATAEIGEAEDDTADDEADPPAGDAEDDGAGMDAVDPPPPEARDPVSASAAIRAEALAHAAAVIDLCALAGLPLQARRFLEAGASLDEVRAALLAARADATPEVTALHPQPGRSADARPWGEVIARTFKPRG